MTNNYREVLGFLAGIVITIALERALPLLNSDTLPGVEALTILWLILAVLVIALCIWLVLSLNQSEKRDDDMKQNIDAIIQKMRSNVQICSYLDGYDYLQKWLPEAEEKIIFIIYFHTEKPFLKKDHQAENKKLKDAVFRWRKSLDEFVEKEQKKEVSELEIIRILQIPGTESRYPSRKEIQDYLQKHKDKNLERGYDIYIRNFFNAIRNTGLRFQLKASRVIYQGTIVFIDEKKLLIDFLFWKSIKDDAGEFRAPFTLVAESESKEDFSELQKLFDRYIVDMSVSIDEIP